MTKAGRTRYSVWHRTLIVMSMALPPMMLLPLMLGPVKSPLGISGADDFYHVAGFALLMVPHTLWPLTRPVWPALALFAFGLGIEAIQPIFARGAELTDLVANAIGIASGAILGTTIRRLSAAVRP